MSQRHIYRQHASIEAPKRSWAIAGTVATALVAFASYGVLLALGI